MTKKINLNKENKKVYFLELNKRFRFIILYILIYRIGSFIPIPGINILLLKKIIKTKKYNILNILTSDNLSRISIFSLGMMPYISASIIIKLFSIIKSYIKELKKTSFFFIKKRNNYINYITLILSIFQAISVVISITNNKMMHSLIITTDKKFYLFSVISLVTGSIFLMFLCEKLTKDGIGNGISTIIFTGIISRIPKKLLNSIKKIKNIEISLLSLLIFILLILFLTFFLVFIEYGQRRIFVSYAKNNNKFNSIKNTHLPLKINMSGVIPVIFTYNLILLIKKIIKLISKKYKIKILIYISKILKKNNPLYIMLYIYIIINFCFFYTTKIVSPIETADNLKKTGAFIPGIRPGEQTYKYINLISTKLNFFGSIYIIFICFIPELISNIINIPLYIGGTSLLIIVITIIDYLNQIYTLLLSNKYNLNFKTINLK